MKLKFNWGTGIALTYILFVVAILIMVFTFMNQDVILETNDYYAKGLDYQKQIDKIERTNKLPKQLEIISSNGEIIFHFPEIFKDKEINGEIHFYRPSNNKFDFTQKINLDSNLTQKVITSNLPKGLWKIKVDWYFDNNNYYNEKIIMAN